MLHKIQVHIIWQDVQYIGTNDQWRHHKMPVIVFVWISALLFLYTLVDTLNLQRQLPNLENDFTGSKTGFVVVWPVLPLKGHRHSCVAICADTMWDTHLKRQPWICWTISNVTEERSTYSCGCRLLQQMERSIFNANHGCPRNSQGFCGKLDLALWCPIGAAHRLTNLIVLRDVQAVEDQQDQNYSSPYTIRWTGGTGSTGHSRNIFLRSLMSI